MSFKPNRTMGRRAFLAAGAGAAGLVLGASPGSAAPSGLRAGEATVEITPPLGIEMGGFHRSPGNERRIRGIRQPTFARALVLQCGSTTVAVCSLDVACVGREMADRIRNDAAREAGIPPDHVRVASTHTHSMPGFCFLRQWGAIPRDFMAVVERRTVEAVRRAKADLAPAELLVGKSRAAGGNHNRTTKTFKTDEQFGPKATDDQRWLDTTIHAMLFPRAAGKRTLLWYHFSAHAVCYADEMAGPDWPGEVAQLVRESDKLEASFLQGHCGDVNPGDGKDWRGEIRQTVSAIYPALRQAIANASPVKAEPLGSVRSEFRVPYDLERFKDWLARYRRDPKQCVSGEWVDAGFAEDWFRGNANRDLSQTHLPITLSAIRLGDVGIVFHPAELYSFYGLAIRRDSPLPHTLVTGYTDGIIGYLPDPKAYAAGEYAAITVPKILDYPPFAPDAARQTAAAASALLRRLA
ncbi:MAG: neutral/alkaline non-lysosomal ceramidase N-terminal domain-containing protein [Thermoguttaceae bacterium]|jgi:hypothetical protein|nr:neutral/alkaline non-lysosomal ceramidase N-terminal domain-containing protein [Thermoguttaceae bacterium]